MMQRLIPLVFLLMAAGIAVLYINPTYTVAIAEKKDQLRIYDDALIAADKFTAQRTSLAQKKAEISKDDIERIEAFLPDDVKNVQLILDLNTLAKKSGLTAKSWGVENAQGSSGTEQGSVETTDVTDSLKLTLSASGSYSAFRAFLDAVEKSLRLIDVMSVSVKAGTGTGVYDYEIVFRLYWLR